MSVVYSTTNEEQDFTNNEIEKKIIYDSIGTLSIGVKDEFLNTDEALLERAESIFLDRSHIHKFITFETYFLEDVEIGDIVNYSGTFYKVIEVNIKGSGAKVSLVVKAKRWD